MFEILDARSPSLREQFTRSSGDLLPGPLQYIEASRLTSSRSVRLFTCQRAHKQLHTSVKTFVFSVVFPQPAVLFPVRGGGILSSSSVLSTAVAKIFPAANRSRETGFCSRSIVTVLQTQRAADISTFAAVQAPRQIPAVGLNPTQAVQSVTGGLCSPNPNLSSGINFLVCVASRHSLRRLDITPRAQAGS